MAPKRLGLSFPSPWRPDPPRCCVDLQRLTARRSCSPGFAAPPSPLLSCDRGPGVFRWTASRKVSLPIMYRSWPYVHPRGPRPLLGMRFRGRERPFPLSRIHPPVELFAPSALPVRGVHFPTAPSPCGSHRLVPVLPRRGVPIPLRSAFAVSHDPDGLLLLEPCGVFRPLTPWGFVLPAPCYWCPSSLDPKALPFRTRGANLEAKGSRSVPPVGGPKPSPVAKSPLPPPKRWVRLRFPLPCASPLVRHPLACANLRSVTSSFGVAPSGPPRQQAAVTRAADPGVGVASFAPRRP